MTTLEAGDDTNTRWVGASTTIALNPAGRGVVAIGAKVAAAAS